MTARTKEQIAVLPADNNGFAIISNEKLLQLYTMMVKCRMIEERASALFGQRGSAVKVPAILGHDASAVAVAIDLLPGDIIAPSHSDPILNFIQGASPESVFRLFAGVSCAKAAAGPEKLSASPARSLLNVSTPPPARAAQLDIAIDAALASKKKKSREIAVAFYDVSTQPDSLDQALSVAVAKRLPILFVCQNSNALGSHNPVKRPPLAKNLAAPPTGIPSVVVDGNDVVAVYRVATEAITHARKGSGPTLIECVSMRHDGAAALRSGKLRSLDQRHGLRSVDPILIMESYLTRKGLFSRKIKREVADRFSLELDAAIKLLNS